MRERLAPCACIPLLFRRGSRDIKCRGYKPFPSENCLTQISFVISLLISKDILWKE
jgi:hypothetical protein